MRPIDYYIGILSVMGYVYCLPLAGQAGNKVVRGGNSRLEYTDLKVGRSTDGKVFTASFNIAGSVKRLGAQEIVYIYPSLVSSDVKIKTDFLPLCISGRKRYKVVIRRETLGGNPDTSVPVKDIRKAGDLKGTGIRSLNGGKVYTDLLSTVYPVLRRTVFRMSFDVRPYMDDELEEMFITVPGCLSLYEMCRLAQLYTEQGKNPVNIYRKAYEQFAPDPLATLNYANALLKYEKDADKALMILDTIKSDSRSVYPMAIAHNMKGDWRKAEELLKKDMEPLE